MKYFFVYLLCLSFLSATAQTIEQIDSLNLKICQTLEKNKSLKDEERINILKQEFLGPFLGKIKDTIKQKEAFDKVFYRLQKNCNEFVILLSAQTENKSDWKILNEAPTVNISDKQCGIFFSNQNYFYKENDGSLVNVTITDNTWTEEFEDKSFSKLILRKKDHCSFELEFIESNNHTRKNLSIKGDRYFYQIYEVAENIYKIYTPNDGIYYAFKMYLKK